MIDSLLFQWLVFSTGRLMYNCWAISLLGLSMLMHSAERDGLLGQVDSSFLGLHLLSLF